MALNNVWDGRVEVGGECEVDKFILKCPAWPGLTGQTPQRQLSTPGLEEGWWEEGCMGRAV